ncbi:MAG: c-type cytochrome [Pseudomonadota bacterium]
MLALLAPLAAPAPQAVAQVTTPADAAAAFALGKRLFAGEAMPACAVCHTLKDAASSGEVGPVLDELRPDAGRVAQALRHGVGAMPSYRGKLTDAQIEALAHYVSQAAAR